MILDLAGQKKDAAKRFERAYKLDPTALRVVQSYGSFLSRQGNTAEALKIFATFDEALPRHPLMLEAIAELKAGKKLPPLIDTPQAGAAEVLYGLGAALGRRGGEDLGLVYLQLALYLAPSHPLALLSLGDLYEAMKKPELANKIYERVPLNSPLQRNAQIQLAMNLDALDRTDEAKASLEKLIAANPGRPRSHHGARQCPARAQAVRRMRRCLLQGRRHPHQDREVELGHLLLPRHLLRALEAMGEGRGRSQEGARAVIPTSRTSSTISVIRGSTRASISTTACA